ncbi:MAG: Rieske 2Fe-2S domain-containing protein, partial [Acidobacteria bacterium]|nr:Rieske 2Fe-2S domain-containing protein [Acidobacteriota bacterium]
MSRSVKIAETSDLSPGDCKSMEVEGQTIALFKVGDTFYAIHGICTPYGAKSRPTLLSGRHRPTLGSFLAPYGVFWPPSSSDVWGLSSQRSTTGCDTPRPRVFAHCLLGSKSEPAANTRKPCNCLKNRDLNGAQGRNRTTDTLIFSHRTEATLSEAICSKEHRKPAPVARSADLSIGPAGPYLDPNLR